MRLSVPVATIFVAAGSCCCCCGTDFLEYLPEELRQGAMEEVIEAVYEEGIEAGIEADGGQDIGEVDLEIDAGGNAPVPDKLSWIPIADGRVIHSMDVGQMTTMTVEMGSKDTQATRDHFKGKLEAEGWKQTATFDAAQADGQVSTAQFEKDGDQLSIMFSRKNGKTHAVISLIAKKKP